MRWWTGMRAAPALMGTAFVALLAGAPLRVASGQQVGATSFGADGTVTGVGIASIEHRPELVRMQMEIGADGRDAKEALANLRTLEKAAREKLAKLGASDAAVHLDDPHVVAANAGGNNQRAQMERMIRARTGAGGAAKPTTSPAAPPVHVSATIKAEWTVQAKSPDDLLVEASALQAKVKEANLGAGGGKSSLTPEQQEEAEEQAGLQNGGGGDGTEMPAGEPMFLYVSKISDAERAKATGEAYQRAKADAARLAQAASANLGALRQLSSTAAPDDSERLGGMDYNSPYGRAMYGLIQRLPAADGEAIAVQPGKITYRVLVTASFALKAP